MTVFQKVVKSDSDLIQALGIETEDDIRLLAKYFFKHAEIDETEKQSELQDDKERDLDEMSEKEVVVQREVKGNILILAFVKTSYFFIIFLYIKKKSENF